MTELSDDESRIQNKDDIKDDKKSKRKNSDSSFSSQGSSQRTHIDRQKTKDKIPGEALKNLRTLNGIKEQMLV